MSVSDKAVYMIYVDTTLWVVRGDKISNDILQFFKNDEISR